MFFVIGPYYKGIDIKIIKNPYYQTLSKRSI